MSRFHPIQPSWHPRSWLPNCHIRWRQSICQSCQPKSKRKQGLLWKHASVFLSQDGDLGCTNLVPIKLLSWMRPPSVSTTGVFHHQNTRWSKSTSTCSRSACVQVIHESSSLFASPIVLVEKKDGSLHLCVDYWQTTAGPGRMPFLFLVLRSHRTWMVSGSQGLRATDHFLLMWRYPYPPPILPL